MSPNAPRAVVVVVVSDVPSGRFCTLNGMRLCFLPMEEYSSGEVGSLAYVEHVDAKGDLLPNARGEDSYAHTCDNGKIMRYGAVVGRFADLIFEDVLAN